MDVEDTFAFMLGHWVLRRSITDHRQDARGTFRGEVVIAEEAGAGRPRTATYEETGELRMGEHAGQACRRLRYVAEADGSVTMLFADGRRFAALDLRSSPWRTDHPCGEDVYEITVVAESSEQVREHWRVRGPAKAYDAVTVFTRLPGPRR